MQGESFWDSFESLPLWTMTSTHFVCKDERTHQVLQTIPRPTYSDGKVVQPLKPFKAYLARDVVIEASSCSIGVHRKTRAHPTKSKRILPRGAQVEIQLSPCGDVWTNVSEWVFHVCVDHLGQDDCMGMKFFANYFTFVAPEPLLQTKRQARPT